MEEPLWLGALTTPAILVVSPPDLPSSLVSAIHGLDPAASTLPHLLDRRGRSKQSIHYLTPTMRLSNTIRFHFSSFADQGPGLGSANLDTELQHSVGSFPPLNGSSKAVNPYPWFTAFKHTLFKSTQLEGEFCEQTGSTFHLPSCVLIAVYLDGLDAEAAVQAVRGLVHQNGGLHPHAPRVVVLVAPGEQEGQDALARVKHEFDSAVLLSLTGEREFDLSFHQLCEGVVKALSNRVFALNDYVAQQKKGLTNTFRSFFSSSPAPPPPSKNGQESLAHKTRSLADLLFMLRDYDGALQTYVHLRDDYSKDASEPVKLGSALEMMARCLLVLKQQPEKRCEALERAIDCFVKSAASSVPANAAPNAAAAASAATKRPIPLAYRLATNATVLLLEASVPGTSFAKASLKLLRRVMSVESEICCAVLLEQAALLTQQQLKMRRKACFDVLRAGSLFRTLGLNAHAFRCYMQMYREDIQRGSAWFAAEHHLQLNLGYLARNLRDGRQLVDLRGALLERGLQIETNPASLHQSLLREYLDAIAPHQVVRHQIPKLEPRATALVSQAFAQERAVFAVMVTNPLACAIVLTEVQIVASEVDGEQEPPMYVCEPLRLALQPKETRLLEVGFTPQRAGEITIKGVQWKLGEHHGSFQHLVLPPVVTKVLPKQACLEATVLAFPHGKFQLEMRNVGALDLPAGELLVTCSDPGSVLLGQQHNLTATSETSVTLHHPELKMGETFTLQSRLLNQVDECVVQYGEGKRSLRVQLPSVPRFEPPLVKANVVFACGQRLLVVDVSSKFPICPTGLAVFSPHAACSVIPVSREFVGGKPGFATAWQLAFHLGQGEGAGNVVQLVPDAVVKTEALSPQDDFRFRFHHLKAVASEVGLAKQRIEQLRQEMEAKGQLPVSIQDVRRARQNNAAIFQAAGLGKLQYPAGSVEAILDGGEGARFVHVALDWTALEGTGLLPSKSYCCRIPMGRQGLTLSLLPLPTNELYLPSDEDMCELVVTLQIQNLGQSALENVELEIGADERALRGSFPRPDFYLGPTKRVWSELGPGESRDVTVTAVFSGAGVFLLGPAVVRSSTASASLEGERFVVVRRRQCVDEAKLVPAVAATATATAVVAAGEDVFAQVQQALQDDDDEDDSLA